GFLLLGVSIFLPLARVRSRQTNADVATETTATDQSFGELNWRGFARNIALVIAVIVSSRLAANALLPSEFNGVRQHFNSRWVMSLPELFDLPIAIWRANLTLVADYIGSFYSWTVALLFCVFSWFALRRRTAGELTLVLMCATGAMATIFLLRGFTEYLFNTAVIAVLLPLLARLAGVMSDLTKTATERVMRWALLFCAGLILGFWGYQDILMGMSAGSYIERSSRWATANYLKS